MKLRLIILVIFLLLLTIPAWRQVQGQAGFPAGRYLVHDLSVKNDLLQLVLSTPQTSCRLLLISNQSDSSLRIGDIVFLDPTQMPLQSITSKRYPAYWQARSVCAYTAISAEKLPVKVGSNFFLEGASQVRTHIVSALVTAYGPQMGGFMASLLLGESDLLPVEGVTQLRSLGLTHLIAISGANFSFLMNGFTKIIKTLRLPIMVMIVSEIVLCCGYQLLIGLTNFSALRACCFLLIDKGLLLAGIRTNLATKILLGCLLVAAVQPLFFLDVSFQLSFLAWLTVVMLREGGRVATTLREFLLLTISQFYFSSANLMAPMLNIVAGRWVQILFTLAILAIIPALLKVKVVTVILSPLFMSFWSISGQLTNVTITWPLFWQLSAATLLMILLVRLTKQIPLQRLSHYV